MGYPDREAEIEMLETHQASSPLIKVTPVVTAADVAAMIATVQQVYVSTAIKEYTVAIGRATRDSARLRLGASPRSLLQLLRAAKPRRPWMAAILSFRMTWWTWPNQCSPTGSSWTARLRVRATRRRAFSGASSLPCPWPRNRLARGAGTGTAFRRDAGMALMDRLPKHLFTNRGWGLLAAGALSLGCAYVMGRRDLLTLAVLLILLPW